MSVFKKYNGKRINAKHPAYAAARWCVYRRVKGHKTIHQVIPTARTKEEAELAERQLVKQLFDRSFGLTDTTVTFGDFVETTYRKYVEQNNVNKGAKNLYIKLLLKHLKDQPLHTITPQDCRDCRNKLQYGKNQRKKKSSISPSSINRIMSTLSKIFSLACEEDVLDRNPMQYVKALPEPPPRKRLLTSEQKKALWKELESDLLLYRLVQLAVNMPLRRGQLLALNEDVIDFENQRVWVIGSKGRPPRSVPINATAASVLRDLIADKQLPFPIVDRFDATSNEPFDREDFVNAVAAQAIGMVPTREMIRDGLVITMKPKVIILGSEMIAERNLAKSLALETTRINSEQTKIDLEIDAKRRIEEIKVDEVTAETRREREVKERIREMKIEAAQREAEEAVSPIKEGFAQITANIFESASEMADRMKDAKFVSGSLAKRARQMCEWYQLMNFTGDTSLENVLEQLQTAAGREAKQRSPEEMRTALNDLLRMTSVHSKKLLDEDRLTALEL